MPGDLVIVVDPIAFAAKSTRKSPPVGKYSLPPDVGVVDEAVRVVAIGGIRIGDGGIRRTGDCALLAYDGGRKFAAVGAAECTKVDQPVSSLFLRSSRRFLSGRLNGNCQ